jgi:hypothetical protein
VTRRKPTRPTKRQRARAIKVLAAIVENPDAPDYVRAKSANAILAAGSRDADTPEVDPDASRTIVFLPRKQSPERRADESEFDWKARRRAWVEGRRACYCQSLGLPYDGRLALPAWPWPTPGSNPELEDAADRMADAAELAEVARQRANSRPALIEALGSKEGSDVVIYDASTPEGRADYARQHAEAEAAGHRVLGPQ